jgi:uncharacterized protein YbjT (DUF2867 family)
MSDSSVIITGGTGMVGGHALQLCLADPTVKSVTTLGRRATGTEHPRLREVVHTDFEDYSAVSEALAGHDVALYCVGVYTGTVPPDEFRRITFDYTVAFAEALRAASPSVSFCFLSGQGADQSEKSRMAFARDKGAAEKALIAAGFPRLHIFRPGYIYPVNKRKEPNLTYRISRGLWPVLRRVWPNVGVASDVLARAMVHAGLHGTGDHAEPVLENRDIRTLVASLSD